MQQLLAIKKEKGLLVDNHRIELELFLSADWKFLALVLGVNAANSRWFCLWCLCQNDERGLTTIDWEKYRRTINNMSGDKCTNPNCRSGSGKAHPHGVNEDCLLLSELFDLDHIILDVL